MIYISTFEQMRVRTTFSIFLLQSDLYLDSLSVQILLTLIYNCNPRLTGL